LNHERREKQTWLRLPLQVPADEQGSGNKEDAEVGSPELLFRKRSAA
jgi:hypothetical protein